MKNHLTIATIRSLSTAQLIRVDDNLYAAKFDLMKFLPAATIIDDALAAKTLQPGGHVIESSSGTFALALAIVCAYHGLRLSLVTGPVSSIVRWRLEQLGAELVIVPTAKNCAGGIQQARLDRLSELLKQYPSAFWPQQYSNPLNAASYARFGKHIEEALPLIDTLVGTTGSGGSLCGTARYLRRINPKLKTVAVDHNRSVLWGAQPEKITKCCRDTYEQLLAMGAGIVMENLDHSQCDEVHWTPIPMMVQSVHSFHQKSSFLVGPSSGAALAVAQWEAKKDPDKKVLAILPDHGVRYVDTMFNPEWLNRWADDFKNQYVEPSRCESPLQVNGDWCSFSWNRRSYLEVLGSPPSNRCAGYEP